MSLWAYFIVILKIISPRFRHGLMTNIGYYYTYKYVFVISMISAIFWSLILLKVKATEIFVILLIISLSLPVVTALIILREVEKKNRIIEQKKKKLIEAFFNKNVIKVDALMKEVIEYHFDKLFLYLLDYLCIDMVDCLVRHSGLKYMHWSNIILIDLDIADYLRQNYNWRPKLKNMPIEMINSGSSRELIFRWLLKHKLTTEKELQKYCKNWRSSSKLI